MTSTFSFGFSGDDIDVDESEVDAVVELQGVGVKAQQGERESKLPELVQAKVHDMQEWVGLIFFLNIFLALCIAFSGDCSSVGGFSFALVLFGVLILFCGDCLRSD